MTAHRLGLALGSALTLAAGCYQGLDAIADDIVTTRNEEFNSVQMQGVSMQGVVMQGVVMQGISMQGTTLQGTTLQGTTLQGTTLQGVTLQGTTLQGTTLQGLHLASSRFTATYTENGEQVVRSGEDFMGSEFKITVTQTTGDIEVSEDFILRIDHIYPDPNYDDVWLYDISYRPAAVNAWQPLCGDDVAAIPLNNYWDLQTGDRIDDPSVVTFACTNAVLAKCVEWGYRPWASGDICAGKSKKGKGNNCDEVSLRDYHQACTRMARADYCGDGQSWTVNGTAIDISDNLSPAIQEPGTDWDFEAEWTPDGASCLNGLRHPELIEEFGYPSCFTDHKGKPEKFNKCGEFKKYDGILRSAFEPTPPPCKDKKGKKGKKCK